MAIDTKVLDDIIHGKIEPKIYAFHTGTIPDYLKVGDTYRPVVTRLNEWRQPGRFPDLIPIDKTWDARLDENTYFRDLEVHSFLECDKHYARLQPGQFPGAYYSREFFKDATEKDIDEAVKDIAREYSAHSQKYQFYNLEQKHAQTYTYLIFCSSFVCAVRFNCGIYGLLLLFRTEYRPTARRLLRAAFPASCNC